MSGDQPVVPETLDAFMLQALSIEREAVARYDELADMMETHNNGEVGALFRKMAEYEARHVEQILATMRWTGDVASPAWSRPWPAFESPEAVPIDEIHYLMQPWHALQLALAAERRARDYFSEVAARASDDAVRRAALQMRDEEAEHVALVQAWLERVPRPDKDWSMDPDPPRLVD